MAHELTHTGKAWNNQNTNNGAVSAELAFTKYTEPPPEDRKSKKEM